MDEIGDYMNKPLFTEERRKRILEQIQREGRVQVKELAVLFSVTEDAIRKDLRFLDQQGLVQKTYGGALLPSKASSFIAYKDRGGTESKKPFAKAAAALIKPGDTVFIESSSYTNLMFYEMEPMPGVTVVTNSIHGLSELASKVKLIHVGGTIHPEDESGYGFFALQTIQQINFDKCFLRTSGISPDWKVSAALQDSLELKQTVIRHSKQKILLIGRNHWNRVHRYNVCELGEMDVVLTDTDDEKILSKLARQGIDVISVDQSIPSGR
ncbi:HTH-type transcriptional repressor glcR [Chlamydia abortus]|nr:HTH-type transcriptional repressor glcR [Chlamydia abortus]